MPVAARYPDATVSNGKTVSNTPSVSNNIDAASTGWRDYFTDPQLQRLIAQALEQNRDLRVAAARAEEARAAYGIQRADLFPSLTGSVGEARGHIPGSADPFGVPLRIDQYQAGAVVSSWELDLWGRLRDLRRPPAFSSGTN